MCTVTFTYKGDKDFILISNRDESMSRKTISPKIYSEDNVSMVYPKDEFAGGTWIGSSSKNRTLCLLNGAFTDYKKLATYKKSRGVIVKELLKVENVFLEIQEYDFKNIAPFTLLLIDWNTELKLIELIWDGVNKQISDLPLVSRIWSSSSLYNSEMKMFREKWFQEYITQNESSSSELLYFHEFYGIGDPMLDLKIDRGLLKTVSISLFEKENEYVNVVYKDLLKNSRYNLTFELDGK